MVIIQWLLVDLAGSIKGVAGPALECHPLAHLDLHRAPLQALLLGHQPELLLEHQLGHLPELLLGHLPGHLLGNQDLNKVNLG